MEEEVGEEGSGGGVQECRAEGEEEVGEEDAGRARTWVGRKGGEGMNNVTDKIYQLQQEVELWASRAWSSPALGLPLASS